MSTISRLRVVGRVDFAQADVPCYRSMTLAMLFRCVCEEADRQALEELHAHRRAFRLHGSQPLRFAEFLDALRTGGAAGGLTGCDSAVLDLSYDLTLDKFYHLPDSVKRDGPDCRLYFAAVLRSVERARVASGCPSELEMEVIAARCWQHHVARAFHFSCLEALRRAPSGRSRYAWMTDWGVLYVWLPVRLAADGRRTWLAANIDDPDPRRPGEQRRVQRIIDERLGMAAQRELHDQLQPATTVSPLQQLMADEITVAGLAETVAAEKLRNRHRLRDAIRSLTPTALRRLILRIFDAHSCGQFQDRALAKECGLSKATFSRFAGSRWNGGRRRTIPDLYANTAEVLANHPKFVDAARASGVWAAIESAAARGHESAHDEG